MAAADFRWKPSRKGRKLSTASSNPGSLYTVTMFQHFWGSSYIFGVVVVGFHT